VRRLPYVVNVKALKLLGCSTAARRTDDIVFAAKSDRDRTGNYAKIGFDSPIPERV